jgi:hypothetical protein
MTTKFPEPKFNSYKNVDGWVLPDQKFDRKYRYDPYGPLEFKRQFTPLMSPEVQQGIIGQYTHFYKGKVNNFIFKACLRNCLNRDTLKTKNLSQEDKLCARECIIGSKSVENSAKVFAGRKRVQVEKGESTRAADLFL